MRGNLFPFVLLALFLSVSGEDLAAARQLLVNGAFDGGKPTEGWRMPSRCWKVVPGEGRDGSNGLVWENDNPNAYVFPQTKIKLEPGCRYRFGAWVKVVALTNAKVNVGMDWRSVQDKWLSGDSGCEVTDNDVTATNGWRRWEGITKMMPENVGMGGILCYIGKGGTGKVIFDNLTIEEESAEPIEFLASSAYRDTAWEGEVRFVASLQFNPVKHPVKTLKAELVYLGADGVKLRAQPVAFDARHAEFRVPAAKMAKGKNPVKARLVVRADGSALAERSIAFTRTDGPVARHVAIDAKGRTLLDGKPFFPLGLFTGRMSDRMIEHFGDSPFNFAMHYGKLTAHQLDLYAKQGVYVVNEVRALVPRNASPEAVEKSRRNLRARVAELGGHPALFAWYLVDEAPIYQVPFVTMANEYLHEIDPDHPTYTVTDKPWLVRPFLPCYDVIGMDPYPIGNRGDRAKLSISSGWAYEAREGMFDLRTMWHVPQAYNWAWHRSGKDRPGAHFPTREEYANMTWQAIAAGANGLCAYAYHHLPEMYGFTPELDKVWGNVCEVADEVKRMFPVLLSDGEPKHVGGVPEDKLAVRLWNHDGKDWLLAVARNPEATSATLELPCGYKSMNVALGAVAKLLPGNRLQIVLAKLGYVFVELSVL